MAVGVTAKAGNVSVVALDIGVTAGKVTKVAAGVTAIAVIIAVVTANITSNVTSFAVNVTVVTIQPS